MNNTNTEFFAEGAVKTAEFIAYITDRVPYFDAAEKKYVLLTKEKISEHIKKANSEGDTLKAFELLEAAKKSFGPATPLLSAQIISKSVRIPGDMHLKLLAKNFNISKSLKEVIYPRMELVLEDLKKLKGVNNERLQQILRSFSVWKQLTAEKSYLSDSALTGVELEKFAAGEGKTATNKLGMTLMDGIDLEKYRIGYSTAFSSLFDDLLQAKEFFNAVLSFLILRVKAEGRKNGMSPEDLDKAFSKDNWETEFDVGSLEQTLSQNGQNEEFLLELRGLIFYDPKDSGILKEEIKNEWFKDNIEAFERGDGFFWNELVTFDYSALLSITEDRVLFQGKPLLEENKVWITNEIFKELCEQCEFKNPNFENIEAMTAQVETLLSKEEFEKAAELQKQILVCKQLMILAVNLAECLLDVPKTSKVVTFTMPASLLGMFEAYSPFILEPIKSKKQAGRQQ